MTFSKGKSFCSTYFKFWGCVEQGSGFTVAKACVDQSISMVGINDIVRSIFFGHPVLGPSYDLQTHGSYS